MACELSRVSVSFGNTKMDIILAGHYVLNGSRHALIPVMSIKYCPRVKIFSFCVSFILKSWKFTHKNDRRSTQQSDDNREMRFKDEEWKSIVSFQFNSVYLCLIRGFRCTIDFLIYTPKCDKHQIDYFNTTYKTGSEVSIRDVLKV